MSIILGLPVAETALQSIASGHNLRAVGVNFNPAFPAFCFTVYAHWGDPDLGNCASGSGSTLEGALAVALHNMRDQIAETAEAA